MNVNEIRRMRELKGPEYLVAHFTEAFDKKKFPLRDFSVQDLFLGSIEGGPELLRAISPRKSGGMALQEAANAVDTSAFSNITGQFIFNRVKEAYNNPEFLWNQLTDTMDTTILGAERVPGVGAIGDLIETVDEGMPYPYAGVNEEYVDLPPVEKRGLIVPLTREIIVADKTGQLSKRAGDVGNAMGINKEKRVIDNAIGATGFNTYKRNGTATNTFLTSGAYINQASSTLTNYTSVEAAELLFDAMTDPNTGEPILLTGPRVMLVPSALKATAWRILNATSVGVVDNQANATTFRTYGGNPVGQTVNAPTITVLSSGYVKNRTGSASTWFYGQPKRAFLYRQAWGIETTQAADNSFLQFSADIFAQFKVSENGKPGVVEPRFWTKLT